MKFFDTRNFLEQQKRPSPSLTNEVSDIFFVMPTIWFIDNFAPDKWSTPKIFRTTPNFS